MNVARCWATGLVLRKTVPKRGRLYPSRQILRSIGIFSIKEGETEFLVTLRDFQSDD